MNIKGLTEKEAKFIQNELRDINLIKKMDEIIKKEIVLKKEDITDKEKEYLIKDEDKNKNNLTTTQKEEELFKINMLSIMNLKDYDYINKNDYFNGSLKERFNKIYIFNRNFNNLKLYIKNNYTNVKKEDFIPIYKLFLINYKISDEVFDTNKILLDEQKDKEFEIYNKYKTVYLQIFNYYNVEISNYNKMITEVLVRYNRDKEKKELLKFNEGAKKTIDDDLEQLQNEQQLIDKVYNENEKYNNPEELEDLYDDEEFYRTFELFKIDNKNQLDTIYEDLEILVEKYEVERGRERQKFEDERKKQQQKTEAEALKKQQLEDEKKKKSDEEAIKKQQQLDEQKKKSEEEAEKNRLKSEELKMVEKTAPIISDKGKPDNNPDTDIDESKSTTAGGENYNLINFKEEVENITEVIKKENLETKEKYFENTQLNETYLLFRQFYDSDKINETQKDKLIKTYTSIFNVNQTIKNNDANKVKDLLEAYLSKNNIKIEGTQYKKKLENLLKLSIVERSKSLQKQNN